MEQYNMCIRVMVKQIFSLLYCRRRITFSNSNQFLHIFSRDFECIWIQAYLIRIRIRIRIRIFIFHNSPYSDNLTTASTVLYQIFPVFTIARIKYIYTIHHDGRLFAHRGLDDLSAMLFFRLWQEGKGGRIKPEALFYSESPYGSGSRFSISKGIRFCWEGGVGGGWGGWGGGLQN
jgi:hypothetical protein